MGGVVVVGLRVHCCWWWWSRREGVAMLKLVLLDCCCSCWISFLDLKRGVYYISTIL